MPASIPRRGQRSKGFTVVELLITAAIIMTLVAMAVPNMLSAFEYAKEARAVGDIHTIAGEIQSYEVLHEKYPDTLADIGFDQKPDPWGNPYQYLNFANVNGNGKMRKDRFLVPINSFFDLYSMGPDGASVSPLTAKASHDDIIYANDGGFIGRASDF